MDRGVFLVIVLAAAISVAGQQKVADLSWLSGYWEMKNESRGLQVTEMWMKPAGDGMMGVGRTLKNGKLTDYEFLRIVSDAPGARVYLTAVGKQGRHDVQIG